MTLLATSSPTKFSCFNFAIQLQPQKCKLQDIVITIVLSLLLLSVLVNVSYWVLLNRCINKVKSEALDTSNHHKITILVCVKNAYQQTVSLLKQIDELDVGHNEIRVVIVDDHSKLPLGENEQTLSCRYPLKIIKSNQNIEGKKSAIHTGLMACEDGIILLTDVDCTPSEQWINSMVNASSPQSVTLGYSPFQRQQSLVNIWARYENVLTAIQYLGWAILGKPYMGVGRNMSLPKSSVANLTLDDLHPSIPGGDDDMLVQYVGKAVVCLDPDSFVYTHAPSSWQSYFAQKRRHYSISLYYPSIVKLRLSFFSFSQIGVFLLSIAGIVLGGGYIVLALWLLRILLMMLCSKEVFDKLEQTDIWYLMPFLDVMLSLYYIVFGFTFLLPKSTKW